VAGRGAPGRAGGLPDHALRLQACIRRTSRHKTVHRGNGLVHNSDRDTLCTNLAIGWRLREAGIAASMGSRDDAHDNVMAESFFDSLETELIDRSDWATKAQARAAVFKYIEV
jgi:Integrase core domain